MDEVVVNRETMRRFYEWCQAEAAELTGWREDNCLPEQDMTPDVDTGRSHEGMPVPMSADVWTLGFGSDPGYRAGTLFAGHLVQAAKEHQALLEGLNALGAIAEQALSEMDASDSISSDRLGEITREHLPEAPTDGNESQS